MEGVKSTISIIGSGSMAAAVAGLAVRAGHAVEVTSRNASKASALAKKIGAGVTTGTFAAVPAGKMVFLAIPYSAVLDVVNRYGEALAGKVLIDMTNPVAPDYTSFVTPCNSFGALEIVNAAPAGARVVKAFNTQFAHVLAAGSFGGKPVNVFLAADDTKAKDRVSAFVQGLGLRPLDVGPLLMARPLEHLCLLSLGLVSHAVKSTNFSIGVSIIG